MSKSDRKRPSLEPEDERPAKAARREEPAHEPFDDALEVNPAIFSTGFSPNSHITGTILSTWPLDLNKSKKLLLRVHDAMKLQVHVTICTGDLQQLDNLAAGQRVGLYLADAERSNLEWGMIGDDKLPYQLIYSQGAMLKILAQGAKEAYILDTRKGAKKGDDEDWFNTPASSMSMASSASMSLDEAIAVGDAPDAMRMSPITETMINPLHTEASVSPPATIRATSPVVSTAARSASVGPTAPNVVVRTTSTVHIRQTNPASTTAMEPAEPTPDLPAVQSGSSLPKRKRVRKRDTRHANNPTLQAGRSEQKPSGQSKLRSKFENLEKKAEAISAKHARSVFSEKKGATSKKSVPQPDQTRFNSGFTNASGSVHPALADLVADKKTQVAGIVVRAEQPKQTRSGDWMTTYSITDPSIFPNAEFTINFFRVKPEALPSAKLGEAMIVKQVKTTMLNSQVTGVGYKENFLWAAYEPARGREYSSPFMGMKMDRAELGYCHEIVDWWREARGGVDGADTTTGEFSFTQIAKKRRPVVELQAMQDSVFCDCIVQVVKIWQDNRSTDLYVTDYTQNPGFGDPNQSTWSLPGRQPLPIPNSFVCKVTLWDTVNERAESIQPLQFYKLRNVRPRWSKGGSLEGSMGMGKDGKETLIRLAEGDETLKALRLRRIAFLKGGTPEVLSRTTSAMEFPREGTPDRRSVSAVPQYPPAEVACVSGMKQGGFYTLIAEVVKVWNAVHYDDFYVTDYTEHPYLMDFQHVDRWQPPPGRRTLQVSVFDDDYRAMGAGLSVGCFVRFEHLHFRKIHQKKKLGDGKSEPQLLAGKIGDVVQRPCKITVLPVTDPSVKSLLRRKADVMKIDIDIPATPPPEAEPDSSFDQTLTPPPEYNDHSFGQQTVNSPQPKLEPGSVSPPSQYQYYSSSAQGPLKNIFHNLSMSSIAALREADAPNIFRVRARVVAFHPGKLRDFVWQQCERCKAEVPINERSCSRCLDEGDDDETLPVPRWRFAFVLEDDQGDTLAQVFCSDDAATTFLADLAPQNLVSHRQTLRKLRSRLAPIIGNLEDYQLRLLKADVEWNRAQSGKGKNADIPHVKSEAGAESEEDFAPVVPGEWADWTLRCWSTNGETRWGVFGCRLALDVADA